MTERETVGVCSTNGSRFDNEFTRKMPWWRLFRGSVRSNFHLLLASQGGTVASFM